MDVTARPRSDHRRPKPGSNGGRRNQEDQGFEVDLDNGDVDKRLENRGPRMSDIQGAGNVFVGDKSEVPEQASRRGIGADPERVDGVALQTKSGECRLREEWV